MKRHDAASIEGKVAAFASRQHGVITRGQLLDAGFTRQMVDRRVRSGRLRPLHWGVYLLGALVGPLEPVRAREMAAVLACGGRAFASHENGALLWGLLHVERDASVHVTVEGVDRGRRPGICAHRVVVLAAEDAAEVDGVPVTSPARTLVDIAARVRPRVLEQAMAEAERKELVTPGDVLAALNRKGRARGAPLLRRMIMARESPAFTRSTAEERLLALVRRGRLPAPQTNVQVAGTEVDFLWPDERVTVEVDGFAYHSSRRSFENDRRRDARLMALGLRIVRVTWRQLNDEPDAVLVRLAQTLVWTSAAGVGRGGNARRT